MRRRAMEAALAAHPFLKDLTARHVAALARCATERIFAAGDFIWRTGGSAEEFYLLTEGRVALEVHVVRQVGGRLATLHAGEVLGWSWVLPPRRWHLDARAIEQVRAIALDARGVRRECEHDHELGHLLMLRFVEAIGHRLIAARTRLAFLQHRSAGEEPAAPDANTRNPTPAE
jgi:CRP/FNR family cyclic AMP-dependent transcriptional regulator